MNEKKVSIIIVNWNGIKFLEDCFNSLNKITYSNYDIIFVDNGSTDSSVEFVKSNFSHVITLEKNGNLGFAEGNNVGIRHALKNRADYIFLLNNDTIVDKEVLTELVNVAESDSNIGMVGSKVYFMDPPDKICYAGGYRKWTTEWTHIGLEEIDKGQYNQIKETDFIYGCALMIKSHVVEDIGLLDADYFTYVEEVDWNYRAKKAGYKLFFVPKSIVYHKIAASDESGRISPIRQYYITRNNLLFLKKNGNLFDLIIFCIFVLPKWILKNLIYLFKNRIIFNSTVKAFADFFKNNFGKATFN